MPTHRRDRTHRSSWCLNGLAASAVDLSETERRLASQRGHEPTLYEMVEDLMARGRIAAPFTEPPRPATPPDRDATA